MNKEIKHKQLTKLINIMVAMVFTFLVIMFISTIPVVHEQRIQIIELESENADLKHEISILNSSIQALEVDLEEMTNQLFDSNSGGN